ncbi:CapA family protein [Candidatus Uhrbacteria bacterium]|nr:CapA family protein [Candidatus Uhrbacteria bacterium]
MAISIGASLGMLILVYPQQALVGSSEKIDSVEEPYEDVQAQIQKNYSGSLPEAGLRNISLMSPTTTILFVGDMMFDRTVATRSKAGGGFDYPFRRIGNLKNGVMGEYDLVIGNLEGPVNKTKHASTKSIVFSFNPAVLPVLKDVGFDAVSQANNHTLDQGRDGAEESLQHLAKAGIGAFGDQTRQDATSSMGILESSGRKFAFIGFNDTDVRLNKKTAEGVLDKALRQADFVIVCMHWGNEYKAKPTTSQVSLAHWFIERGASAVIGGHPHWMESVEVYRGKPIVYSLGNFIFDQDWSKETNYGLAVGLDVAENASELKLFPIKIEKSQPFLLTGTERQTRLDRLAEISDTKLADEIKRGTISSP